MNFYQIAENSGVASPNIWRAYIWF